MKSRQRVRHAIAHQPPDRVPFNFWMDRDALARYEEELGPCFRVRHYGADVIEVWPTTPWWSEVERHVVADAKTEWQLGPLVPSIEAALDLALPDPHDPVQYQQIVTARKAFPDTALFCLILSPFEHLFANLRLQDGTSLDIYDHPKLLHGFLERVTAVILAQVQHVCALGIDVLYLAGDLCGSRGPIIAPRHIEEYAFAYMEPLVQAAHDAGLPVFYHTDGALGDILPMFVEHGFQGVNPLQYHLNDLAAFKRKYGNALALYGGLDNCYAIPDGTPESVRAHVREVFRLVGEGGGLILSTHDIPGHTPRANIEAMVDEIHRCTYRS